MEIILNFGIYADGLTVVWNQHFLVKLYELDEIKQAFHPSNLEYDRNKNREYYDLLLWNKRNWKSLRDLNYKNLLHIYRDKK